MILAGLLAGITAAPALIAQQVDEHRLKAAVLGKFPQFVTWPSEDLARRQSFALCVVRPHRLGPWLIEGTENLAIEGRPVTVREISGSADVPECQLIFFPAGTGGAALRRAGTLPILTVGEDPEFLDRGGIIRVHLSGERLRFDIDAEQARRVGLQLSSQLLRLAGNVRGGRP